MATQSLLFVPDISGFTKFVTQTELSHSRHIISELLSVIINQNELDLNISEIEGDAVLFYRNGVPPTFNEIFEQSKKMFLSFHSYLKSIEHNNVCQCGACTSVTNLTLKFISHYGVLEEVAIDKFNKLIGSDVILVHRLLKNSIPSHEYILLTENYLNNQSDNIDLIDKEIKLQTNIEEINNFGKINSKYISLTDLKSSLPPPTKSEILKLKGKVGKLSIDIKTTLINVHSIISNVDHKKNWIKGLNKIKNSNKINRVNNVHTCEFSNMKMDVTTLSNNVCENEITFSEEGYISDKIIIIFEYVLTDIDNRTNVELRFYSKGDTNKNLFDRIKFKIILTMLMNMMKSNLKRLKKYCEELQIQI
ncbi:MAG: hypothetical protein CO128_00150 [Ignavibacteriales bacterium CG_4_9_14_3_um_filter_30_11]|nr:MAG: hypothetical protein COW08_02030 [Ignavibacteriales bacterium CG12_big_fil_rev_8_21_14_0_65_30_8]PJB00594.1 MAG: hypothetical protein CO128_00150 [Ignavibacteriales bacterium CG_4_9_14_3_um_filter_30_11]